MKRESLRSLIVAGRLLPGQRLVATHLGTRYTANVGEDGAIHVEGEMFKSPSSAAASITGHNTNGWRFWRVESSDRPLADLRQPTSD